MKKLDIISNCFECSWFVRKRKFCGKAQRTVEWQNDEHTGFPVWCPLQDAEACFADRLGTRFQ
jgi:hypothetical protein